MRYSAWLALLATPVINAQYQKIIFEAPRPVNENTCHNACTALLEALPDETFYPTLPADFITSYYTLQQRSTIPACVIRPLSATDVSFILRTVDEYSCPFAVKSGGHARFAGASNIAGGVTIDLVKLDRIDVNPSAGTVNLGPGSRWGKVYAELEPQGVMVPGGRVSEVGVGGFLLGGGLSYMSREYGWAVDGVRRFEVVLGNGSIVHADGKTNPDLYWALRGGGPHFGVVTDFEVESFERTDVWGGQNMHIFGGIAERRARLGVVVEREWSLLYITQSLGRLGVGLACKLGYCIDISNYNQLAENAALESSGPAPKAQLWFSYAYMPQADLFAGANVLLHNSVDGEPAAFAEVNALPTVQKTVQMRNISDLAVEINKWNLVGYRQYWHNVMIKANATLFDQIFDLFVKDIDVFKNVAGVLPSYVFQPMKHIMAKAHKNGGNPMGPVDVKHGELVLLSAAPRWSNEEDDEVVKGFFKRFFDQVEVLAKEANAWHPFVYLNYADKEQDVFAGYGEENRQRLREVKKMYDPKGVLEKLQTGYINI